MRRVLARKSKSHRSPASVDTARDSNEAAGQRVPSVGIANDEGRGVGSTVRQGLMKDAVSDLSLARIVSVGILVLATVVIGVLFFRVMASFFVPLFLAALLVVIFRPLHQALLDWLDGRVHVAAMLTTLCILLLVVLPAGVLGAIAAVQGTDFVRKMSAGGLHRTVDGVRNRLGLELPESDRFNRLDEALAHAADPEAVEGVIALLTDAEQLAIDLSGELLPLSPLATLDSADELMVDGELLAGGEVSAEVQVSGSALPGLAGWEPGGAHSLASANGELDDDDDPVDSSDAEVPSIRSHADTFIENIRMLRELAHRLLTTNHASPLERQAARDEYQQQYWEVRASQRQWMRALFGDSFRSQLKILANPSAAELRTVFTGAQEYLQPRVLSLTQTAGRFLFQIMVQSLILIITLYFFLADGAGMIRTLMRLSPLDDAYEERLLRQFDKISRAVVLATVLSALTQGIFSTFAFWILGLDSLVLLFLATTFMAFIPFLGPPVVWIPVAIYLATVEERFGAALGLTLYGLTVVATVDNAVRMFVLKGNSQLHPLLALLSVLGGLQVFGPIGILVGPMVVVFLQTLLEILHLEVSSGAQANAEQQRNAAAPDPDELSQLEA